MTQKNQASVHVTVFARSQTQAESLGENLVSFLRPFGLEVVFQHVSAEEECRCTARVSTPSGCERVFDGSGIEAPEVPGRVLEWLRGLGVAAADSHGEAPVGASSFEEQVVLRRLTDLGYL